MDLRPDQSLIDSNFDGYKLSLDPLPIYKNALEGGLYEVRLHDDQYSYQHVKAYGSHNHLVTDPWYSDTLYYVDQSWNIRRYTGSATETSVEPAGCVYEIPDGEELRQRNDRLSVTLHPTSRDYLCVSDGTGRLYILHTGDRKSDAEWKVCYKGTPVSLPESDPPVPSVLLHSIQHTSGDISTIECLLLHVEKNTDSDSENKTPHFLTWLTWITLQPAEEEKWAVTRTRHLTSSSDPDFAVITDSGEALVIASETPYTFIYDSLHAVEKPPSNGEQNGDKLDASYAWTQTNSDLTVFLSLPPSVTKPDISYTLTSDTLELGVKNGSVLLQGALYANVDVEGSTWTLSTEDDQNKFELHLEKSEEGVWPEVIVGDQRGHLVADLDQIEEIHQRLSYLTSDQLNPDPSRGEKAYNSQQLEECDAYPDTHSAMVHIHGDTHDVTHKANLSSHQWLFNKPGSGVDPPCVCIRHDVDGLVWQPVSNGNQPWTHIATFNAFGYVQASKQQKKYCTCAPDFSFAVICDIVRHVYIYRQPAAITSPLRNRKTGREVSAVAKQQLISLESVDNIMGLSVHSDKLYLATKNTLFMVKISE